MSERRGWALLRALTVAAAAVLAGLVVYAAKPLAELIAHRALSIAPIAMPAGVSMTLYFFYLLFVVGSAFPFFLFLGWLALSAAAPAGDGPPPFVSVIIPAFNEE